MVSLDEFEAKWENFGMGQHKTPKVANKKSAASVSKKDAKTAEEKSVDPEKLASKDGSKKDIGFRIEPLEVKAEAVVPPPKEQPVASSSTGADDERSLRFAKQILDHVAIIFPSAVRHVSEGISSVHRPTVVIRPTFFATNDDEELFLALDRCAGAQFLLKDRMEAGTSDFFQWLRLRLSSGEGTAVLSVPLYALMLARFEWTIREAFRARRQDAPHRGGDMGNSAVKGSAVGKDFLVDLFSYCRDADLTMAIDTATLASCVSPLAEACLLNESDQLIDAGRVEKMIMTPFSWILCATVHKGSVDFGLLDKAVAASLQNMSDHGSSANHEVACATSTEHKETASSATAESTKQTNSSYKKKKKKTKKRKVRHRCLERLLFILVACFSPTEPRFSTEQEGATFGRGENND